MTIQEVVDFWVVHATAQNLGFAATLFAAIASLKYLLAIVGRPWWYFGKIPNELRTRPNRATWFVWTALGFVILLSYIESGAHTTIGALIVVQIEITATFILSLKYGEGGWSRLDICCLAGAAISAFFWWHKGPEVALLVALTVDVFGAIPTIVKAWKDPEGEDRGAWSLSLFASTLNVFAVEDWSKYSIFTPPLYYLCVGLAVTIPLWRRRKPVILLGNPLEGT